MAESAKKLTGPEVSEIRQPEARNPAEVVYPDDARAQIAKNKNEEKIIREQDLAKAAEIKEGLSKGNESPEDPRVKSAKEKYTTEYLDRNQSKLSQHFEDLIDEYKKQSDTQKQAEIAVAFEATIEYCINKGKSTAERVMLNIIHGIAEGVIRQDHIQYYQKYSANLPPLNYILSQNFNDLKKLAKKFPKYNKTFQNFYWTEIVGHPDVKKAINKNADKKIWDHDYAGFAAAGNIKTAKEMTAMTDEHEQPTTTAQENDYAGLLAILRANKNEMKQNPNKFTDRIGFFLAFRRLMSADMNSIPRTAIGALGQEMTMSQIDSEIWTILMPLEKKLFGMLKDPNTKFENLQKYLKNKYNIQIENINEFYERLDEIMPIIFPGKKPRWFFG
jgi:hypothetical protein